jgi:asparagine synthase (glutamine-hydrolysing)
MFAFAVWDRDREELFVARDQFGIKPLYYSERNGRFAFASEIKAILQIPGFERRLDDAALDQFLTFLWVPDPATAFAGIRKLPAGHYATYRNGRLDIQQYWDLAMPRRDHDYAATEDELVDECRSRFETAVARQMLSDVPVGAFLSAGIDSSSIVAAMSKSSAEPVSTYTIGFADKYRRGETHIDDPEVAARTAAYFGCRHTAIVVEPDVVDLLPRLIWHMDEPVADPAILTAYIVCREARKSSTVMLSGIGGDELFAGYRKHVAWQLGETWRRVPAVVRHGMLEPAIEALPVMRGTPLKGPVRLLKKLARSASLSPQQAFLAQSVYCSERLKQALLTPELAVASERHNAMAVHDAYFDRVRDADFVNQMLYVDTKSFMVSLNLTYNDKMSMASSVEVRVPFLDVEFAEWVAAAVPPSQKLKGRSTKHLLRRAMAPVLPAEVLAQKKAGFTAPLDYWLAYDLREMVDDLLGETAVKRRALFNPAAVRTLIDEQRSGRRDWTYQIWQLLTLELWHQAFIDGKAA